MKAFVSRCDDKYRASFGKRVTPHPRQCVFFGTTNSENGYLRDITGNRRFWNVKVRSESRYKPWEMTEDLIDQIWAEVILLAKAGEKLYLPPHLEEFAQDEQRKAMEQDDREGLVTEYLEMLLSFAVSFRPRNISRSVSRQTSAVKGAREVSEPVRLEMFDGVVGICLYSLHRLMHKKVLIGEMNIAPC